MTRVSSDVLSGKLRSNLAGRTSPDGAPRGVLSGNVFRCYARGRTSPDDTPKGVLSGNGFR